MNKAKIKRITGTVIIAVLVVVVCVIGIIISNTRIPDNLSPGAYRAVFFDVGEADCILFHGDGAVILTDAPANETERLTGYMERMRIKQIDYFIISHYDADHAGDAVKIINKFKPSHVLMPEPLENQRGIYNEIVKVTTEKQRITAKTGQRYNKGGVVIDILAPNGKGTESNDMCIVCKISYGDSSLLLCSDIDTDAEKVILSKYGDKLKSDVLKVAHHGSRYSSSDAFICTVSPNYAVISCGQNTFGHPDIGVMDRLKAIKAEVLTTQQNGVIIFDFFSDSVVKVK
jgi:competence protein ComEC